MNKRTITGIATAALVTTAGISVTNNLKKSENPSEGVVQAATVQNQSQAQTPQQQFLNKAVSAATTASSKYGTYTSVMVAQAAVESGWGQSTLSQAPNNNLFGIKGSYNGQSVNMNTGEYGSNGYYMTNAAFRKYPSYTESFEDNGALLRNGLSGNNAYYSGTWVEKANSGTQATQGLQGRYATAPNYAQQLNTIITQNNLTQYDPKTQQVNETRTVVRDTPITTGPYDASVGKTTGTARKGQNVNVSEYVTYANSVKYALTNLGWLNAVAFGGAAPTTTTKPAATKTQTLNVSKVTKPVKQVNDKKSENKATTPKYTVIPTKDIVRVKNAPAAGLDVLKQPAGQKTGQKLQNGSRWKVSAYTTVKNTRYNKVGTNQWISDEFVAHNAVSTPAAKPASQAPTVAVKSMHAIAKVNYMPGYGIAVWSTPGHNVTGQYLPHESRWKVNGVAQYEGREWYRVGTNQWIDSQYLVLDNGEYNKPAVRKPATQAPAPKATTRPTAKKSGVITVNYRDDQAVTVWNQPGGQPTGRYLTNHSNWKYFDTTEAYGQTWFNLGGSQWVPSEYVYAR